MTYNKDNAVERLIDAGCDARTAMALVQGIDVGIEACDDPRQACKFHIAVERTLTKVEAARKQARVLGIIVDIESEKYE